MTTARGSMLVISSPSGTGKTTICRYVLEHMPGTALSVSATTRARRPGEENGKDYHFLDHETFAAQREQGAFVEWARVHGEYYGTPAAQIEDLVRAGTDVIFDVDWQGARALQMARPGDVVSVFVLPPSMSELRARLEKRPGATPEITQRRFAGAAADVRRWSEYDFALVNADLDVACADISAILSVRRIARGRAGLAPMVDALLAGQGQTGYPFYP